jgi:hypothetical protein
MKFSKTAGSTAFKLEQLDSDAPIRVFSCSVEEYDEYLHISKTTYKVFQKEFSLSLSALFPQGNFINM